MDILKSYINLKIAGRLKNARTAVIMLMGEDKFLEKVDGFRPIFTAICDSKSVSEYRAALEVLKTVEGKGTETMLAMAACAEIIEPRVKIEVIGNG